MNFVSVIVLFASVFLALVHGLPAIDTPVENPEETVPSEFVRSVDDFEPAESGTRFRRVTCDLLSISIPIGSLNHSACAAHCLAMRKGYRGGRCRDGVCHCRR